MASVDPGAGVRAKSGVNAKKSKADDLKHDNVPLASRAGCKNFWEQITSHRPPQGPFFREFRLADTLSLIQDEDSLSGERDPE